MSYVFAVLGVVVFAVVFAFMHKAEGDRAKHADSGRRSNYWE